jgi:hypothetical protein
MTIQFSFDKRPNMNATCMCPVPPFPQTVRERSCRRHLFTSDFRPLQTIGAAPDDFPPEQRRREGRYPCDFFFIAGSSPL